MKKIFLAGLAAGLQTTWTLGKVIFPVTLLVTLLQHTPVMDWLVRLITPVMGLFGLSGEAAIPLVLGNMLNLYAGIAGILTLDLSVKEVFILAVMLSFCHNLIIESTVAAKVGIRIGVILAVRIGLAAVSAIVINLIWHGGRNGTMRFYRCEERCAGQLAGNAGRSLNESRAWCFAAGGNSNPADDHHPVFKRFRLAASVLQVALAVYAAAWHE